MIEFVDEYCREATGDLDGPPCHVCGAIMVLVMPCACDNEGFCGFSHEGYWQCKSCGTDTRPS
jgi:hypothetical protein